MGEAEWLCEWLGACAPGALVRVRVRFPEVDWEVDTWAFPVSDSLTGPTITVDAHGADFGYPDPIRRLKKLVEEAAYYNFID